MITRVTGKNQVTIPAALARELKITPGTRLEWSRSKGENGLLIRVKPSPKAALLSVQEMVGAYRINPAKALAALETMREEDEAVATLALDLRRRASARLPLADACIAACAVRHGLTLLHCDRHFAALPADAPAQDLRNA